MRFSVQRYAVFLLFLAACTFALADPVVHTTLALEDLHRENSPAQKPLEAAYSAQSYAFTKTQPMQAASEAGSAERPVGKIVVAVVVSGVLFGLGMGM